MPNPNPVLEAYFRGTAEKRQTEQQVKDEEFRQKQLKQQVDEFKTQHDELLRQHDIENARQETVNKFNQSIAELKQQEEIQQHYAQTGLAPSDSTVTESNPATFSSPYQDISGAQVASIPTNYNTNTIPKDQAVIKYQGNSIPVMSPEANAQQQAKVLDITQGPLIERQAKKEQQILTGQQELKKLEIKAQEIRDENAHKAKLEEIRLQESLRGANRSKSKLDLPIDPKTQRDEFGLSTYDPTLTLGKAQGLNLIKPLTPVQEDKNADLSDLQLKTLEVQKLLEEKTSDGKTYYSKYFQGAGTGFATEISSKFTSLDPKLEAIRQKLASIELKSKNAIGKLGGALTTNEQALLEKESPSPSFSETPGRAKAKIEGFLEGLDRSKNELIKQQKVGGVKSSGDLYFDKDGNIIPNPKGK